MDKHIYIAGPLTKGDSLKQAKAAIAVADQVMELGCVPFVPHLCYFWDELYPHEYEFWMGFDLAWLHKCDGLLRIPGESMGADREVDLAHRLGIPVFDSVARLAAWLSLFTTPDPQPKGR